MSAPLYGPVDLAVQEWLKLRIPSSMTPIYLAMPKSAPLPAMLCTLIGGGPVAGSDLPQCLYRLSFDCLATSRNGALTSATRLVSELQYLGVADNGYEATQGVYLGSASVLNMRWQPDPDSDTPRYIVDALITTVL